MGTQCGSEGLVQSARSPLPMLIGHPLACHEGGCDCRTRIARTLLAVSGGAGRLRRRKRRSHCATGAFDPPCLRAEPDWRSGVLAQDPSGPLAVGGHRVSAVGLPLSEEFRARDEKFEDPYFGGLSRNHGCPKLMDACVVFPAELGDGRLQAGGQPQGVGTGLFLLAGILLKTSWGESTTMPKGPGASPESHLLKVTNRLRCR